MINFKKMEISDREWVNEALKKSDFQGCEYSFANNFIWSEASTIEIADVCGRYAVKWGEDEPSFLFPAGGGDLSECINQLIAYCDENGCKLRFYDVPKNAAEELLNLFPGEFEAQPDRDSFDYIYNSSDLIELKGKKYHSKRNFINRFKGLEWSFEKIDKSNIDECYKMNEEWCVLNDCSSDESKKSESYAVKRALEYFDKLGFVGGLIRLDGKVSAFSIGERLNSDTIVVHIEKAFSDIPGAYPLINREFSKCFSGGFKYVNREDDVGSQGLRKAKLSYNPAYLYEKYTVIKK